MPKIIEGLQEKITAAGKKVLLSEGYAAMSMRRVADECDIAVGTIYNYVKNKQELLVSIVLKDWNECVGEMRRQITGDMSFSEGALLVLRQFDAFKNEHLDTFRAVARHPGEAVLPYEMHPQLTEEIAGLIDIFLHCDDPKKAKAVRMLTAEMVIATAQHPNIDEEMLQTLLESLDLH